MYSNIEMFSDPDPFKKNNHQPLYSNVDDKSATYSNVGTYANLVGMYT